MTNTNNCHCIIRHAITPDERAEVGDVLHYSRSIGDRRGIMLSLWALQPCPSAAQPANVDGDTPAQHGS
jgi:hypothetical protein